MQVMTLSNGSNLPNNYMGIILYDIQRDGCLNGVYTNLGIHGEVFNEVCRKQKGQPQGLCGRYDCMWFDLNNERISDRELNVTPRINAPGIFEFEWVVGGKVNFVGIGYQMNYKQIALTYWV
ncbi:MAG: hypothetical protein JST90_18920 [Bacteroidetes bacterium]|nr:hypothetical protein [Bacteroidota bacterium]